MRRKLSHLITMNHFELFHLPSHFELDMKQLDRAFHEVQSQVHPDKFVRASQAEQRVAMQWATRANEAYQTLKDPLKRASYLCELNGISLQAESNTAMPAAFLMQQMEWREELEESKQDTASLNRIENEVKKAHEQQLQLIARQLQKSDFHEAAQSVRQLLFLEKFSDDIANSHDA